MLESEAPLTSLAFRDAMAHFPAAVHIITTDGPAGRAGFTASAVTSVTDSPPTLLVCLNRSASVYSSFRDNGVLCVNTLGPHHEPLSRLFGGKTPMGDRFAAAQWTTRGTSSPVLDVAAITFDCRIVKSVDFGTHDVFFCEVLTISKHSHSQALVYLNRQYRKLHLTETSEANQDADSPRLPVPSSVRQHPEGTI
ncbi:MAG: pyrimidine utilization flavin reductase protein [Hyphomicrobiales bacterium]|nr:pyrimidine utilization flavin reductase protein [Hyphomicrobiales bacterium]